jgi:Sec-independent protein translocase protein TatA
MSLFAFLMPSGYEFLIFAGLMLLLFGSAQLPKLMRNIGRSKQALQQGLKDGIREAEAEEIETEESKEE